LAADLQANGWPVWIAPDSIKPGEKWVEAINRGLEESGVFVLVVSPAAVESRWVRTETNLAIELEHEGQIRLTPLLFEAVSLPPLWRAYQRIPFRRDYDSGFTQLLARLVDPVSSAQVVVGGPGVEVVSPRERERQLKVAATPNRRIDKKIGIELIRIPAGEFLYGDDNETCTLPEFWISRTPVTNMQYKRFLDTNPTHEVPENWDSEQRTFPADKADHPVMLMNWDDVRDFCKWAGLRLPTEEEWEKAARGTDGRAYPWGNTLPTGALCNFDQQIGDTTPVGRYSPQGNSPYGCVDMAGNVWEWTASWYDKEYKYRVLRGGSLNEHDPKWLQSMFRLPNHRGFEDAPKGFRVCEIHFSSEL
jgi:formylglycine-generating enzyme required for sulfatase activity